MTNIIIYLMQKENKISCKYKPKQLFCKGYEYHMWLKHEEESPN